MLNKKGQFTGWAFNTAAGNNHISSRLNWSNNSDTTFCGEINTLARLQNNSHGIDYNIHILPTQIIIGDSVWHIRPATIDIENGKGHIDRIEVRHQEQYMLIDGLISTPICSISRSMT